MDSQALDWEMDRVAFPVAAAAVGWAAVRVSRDWLVRDAAGLDWVIACSFFFLKD